MFVARSNRRRSRTGVVLAVVLVCIVIAMMLGAALTKSVMLQHRQMRVAERQCQSMWLAESAVQRATAKLRESAGYQGETWEIPASLPGISENGVVEIKVEETTKPEVGWVVTVESRYPDVSVKRVVVGRSALVAARGDQPDRAEE